MKPRIPQPSIVTLIVECGLVLAFTAGLYLFISALVERNGYTTAILGLSQKKQTVEQAARTLESYRRFVYTHPFYQRGQGDLQWEKNDEVWINLEYQDLLARLSKLYREDRPFVLDSFSAGLSTDSGKEIALEFKKAGQNTAAAEIKEKKLVFHLQGYFLCPCK